MVLLVREILHYHCFFFPLACFADHHSFYLFHPPNTKTFINPLPEPSAG